MLMMNRRQLLLNGPAGFGALALSYMLKDHPLFSAPAEPSPLHIERLFSIYAHTMTAGWPAAVACFTVGYLTHTVAACAICLARSTRSARVRGS